MAFTDVKAKTTFTGYTNASDQTAILAVMETAYNGSATFKAMVDSWLATAGHTINFQFAPGALSAPHPLASTGNMNVDVNAVNNLAYIDNNGNAVQVTLSMAVIHELSHALTGRTDNYSIATPDYNGDNDVYVNKIYKELGIPERNSYISCGPTSLLPLNYHYTDGAPIDDSVLVAKGVDYSLDGNFNSGNAANTRDLLIGDGNNNTLDSGGGDDFLFGGGGDDILRGGAGTDTAVYLDSNPADYDIREQSDGSWIVNDVRGARTEGKDTLQNVESLQFDQTQHFSLTKGGLTFETDLVFVIDTTGSMGPYIDGVKSQAESIINALFADGKTDARIAIESFKDTTNGEPSAAVLQFTDQDSFADRQTAAINAINTLSAEGGGDIPETDNDGLIHALNGDVGLWRSGAATKRIILFTDAPVKDTDLEGQVATLAADPASDGPAAAHFAPGTGSAGTSDLPSTETSVGSVGFSDDPANPDTNSSTPPTFVDTVDPITGSTGTTPSELFAIQVGTDSTATDSLKTLASTAGGTYLDAPTADDLVSSILTVVALPPPTPTPTVGALAAGSDSGVTGDDLTNVATPVITGTGEAGDTVTLLDGTTIVGTGTVGADGNWSITASALSDGAHALTATQIKAGASVSTASAPLSVTIDTTAPGAPAGLILTAASDSATQGDDITDFTMPSISGTGEAGDSLTLFDGTTSIGSVAVASDGSWVIAPTLSLGAHSLTATQVDAAGNVSAASSPLNLNVVPADLSVFDTTSNTVVAAVADAYTGPVAGLQQQYIYLGNDAVAQSVSSDNWFLHGGLHDDALQVHGGRNVMDGGVSGSKFLVGSATGSDSFFLDDRNAAGPIFSTMVNFHAGDDATVFGVTQDGATLNWRDNGGATGFTGLTLDVLKSGSPTASLALTGFSQADLPTSMGGSGKLNLSFGAESDGTPYLFISAHG